MHVSKIETMAQNLEDIGQKMSDEQIISKLITSLPSEYRHVLTAWKSMPQEQNTRKTLIMRVFEEKAMNKLLRSRERDETDNALLVHSRRNNEYRRPETDSRSNTECIRELKKSRCHGCGEIGHWWQDNVCSRKDNKRTDKGPETSKSQQG